MANLVVRNIDDRVADALKERAGRHGVSAEAEHRKILEMVLLGPQKKSFIEAVKAIPNVGLDSDFNRIQDENADNVIAQPF